MMSGTERVALPRQHTTTPVARGSSVPAWPVLTPPAARRTRRTTCIELQPSGLSTTSTPWIGGGAGLVGFTFSLNLSRPLLFPRLPYDTASEADPPRVFSPRERRNHPDRSPGEVSERLKEHDWKSCNGATCSRVRIPPSPLRNPRHPRGFFVDAPPFMSNKTGGDSPAA